MNIKLKAGEFLDEYENLVALVNSWANLDQDNPEAMIVMEAEKLRRHIQKISSEPAYFAAALLKKIRFNEVSYECVEHSDGFYPRTNEVFENALIEVNFKKRLSDLGLLRSKEFELAVILLFCFTFQVEKFGLTNINFKRGLV